jgi:hypothetical protein
MDNRHTRRNQQRGNRAARRELGFDPYPVRTGLEKALRCEIDQIGMK